MAPGMIGFAVMFDPIYPALAGALILTWDNALTRQRDRDSVVFGIVLTATIFMAYHLLILGAMLAAMTVWRWRQGASLKQLSRLTGVAFQTVFSLCLIIGVSTGYNVIDAFSATLQAQSKTLVLLTDRTWPKTIVFDLVDFGWAGGWPIVLLAGFAMCGSLGQYDKRVRIFVALGLGQILLTAFTGLLQTETMRVWLFMLPLLLAPATLELSRWPRWAIGGAMFSTWWMCAAVNRHWLLIDLVYQPPG
jgi:hypothetical protein